MRPTPQMWAHEGISPGEGRGEGSEAPDSGSGSDHQESSRGQTRAKEWALVVADDGSLRDFS